MFVTMAGAVGCAMQADRLAAATENLQLAEAEQGRRAADEMISHGYRAGIAAALVALAVRIAPAVARSGVSAGILTR